MPDVLVLDNSPRRLGTRWFGRWLKRLGCRVHAYHALSSSFPASLLEFEGVVLSGSPASAIQDDRWIARELQVIEVAVDAGLPVLGACFGAQLLDRAFYGKDVVRRSERPEFGWHRIKRTADDPLFQGVKETFWAFQFHMEEVVACPGMKVLATSAGSSVQAFRIGDRLVWGTQFHFEVTPRAGLDLLRKTKHVYGAYGFKYEDLASQATVCEAAPPVFSNFVARLTERPERKGDRGGPATPGPDVGVRQTTSRRVQRA